jgi:hypothetical protein
MATRDGAIGRAARFFDTGNFRGHLADLVATPSTSRETARAADIQRY